MMPPGFWRAGWSGAAFVLAAGTAWSQGLPAAASPDLPPLPATFARGADGRSTMRAVRLPAGLAIDGRLDEKIYATIEPASGFLRINPNDGTPAADDTHVWVLYDDDHVYIAVRCFDSQPDRIVANEMRRDNFNIYRNDQVTVVLDTFHDRRSAYFFQTNPLGGVRDALVIDETTTNYDWNTVWDVRSRRSPEGWSAEMAIPFKSLRYPRSGAQTWGINVLRAVRSRNEESVLSPPPATYGGPGLTRLSSAATLTGIEPPSLSRNIEVKPALLSTLTTNRLVSPGLDNDLDGDVSVDAKYGVSSNMTLDLTLRTDFAQIEIDEQQVNLTRFSLFFPEKRDFFLEGQSVFAFGGAGGGGPLGGGGEQPLLFFSRRIGLEGGQPVPIQGGARLTGRAGRTSIGLLDIRTDDVPSAPAVATNFLVARVRQDVLQRSSVGLIATRRTPSLVGRGSNEVYGADASFSLFANLLLDGYYARSITPGVRGDADSYRGRVRFDADLWGFEAERTKAGEAFRPEIGFVRRPDVARTRTLVRASPRPQGLPGVRQLVWEASYDRFVNGRGVLETGTGQGTFTVNFDNSDTVGVDVRTSYEYLPAPFAIAPRVTIPVGEYRFTDVQASYSLGVQRVVLGTISATAGTFFGGDRRAMSFNGRIRVTPQLAVEPRISVDAVDVPQGRFTTTLSAARVIFTLTPRMFLAALVQYNSTAGAIETNARFRWEYEPGSDLFVVYTDGRDTAGPRGAQVVNRGLAVKFTRLFRF